MNFYDILLARCLCCKSGSEEELLEVTENGQYIAPEGKAFNPVIVSVKETESKLINFIDYDGTIYKSYSADEWEDIITLPDAPVHSGLISEGWNWSYDEISEYNELYPDSVINVGAIYITETGDTELDATFPSDLLHPYLILGINGSIQVNWGDGSQADIVSGSNETTMVSVDHLYDQPGDYTISISVLSGTFAFMSTNAQNTGSILSYTSNFSNSTAYCHCIRAIRIGKNVNIRSYGFRNYVGKYISIPNEVIGISSYAFYNSYNLQALNVPRSITAIDVGACQYCFSLKQICLPGNYLRIADNLFRDCYEHLSMSIPKTVTSIGQNSFRNNDTLSALTIPEGVVSIGQYGVYSTPSLRKITIPSTVTSIGAQAFQNSSLFEIHVLPATPPSLGASAFSGIPSNAVFYVPLESLNTYKTASGWSTYSSRMIGE